MEEGGSRRQWLLAGCGAVVGAALGGLYRARSGAFAASSPPLRPPGAPAAEADFLAACIRCGQCVAVCPYATLRSAPDGAGVGAAVPFFVARETPCYLCEDYDTPPCIDACPTDALAPVDDVRAIRIGTARIDESVCWAYTGTLCRGCWHACPLRDEAITLDARLRPVVNEEACVGCGLCEHACPTEPSSIVVDPPRPSRAGASGERTA